MPRLFKRAKSSTTVEGPNTEVDRIVIEADIAEETGDTNTAVGLYLIAIQKGQSSGRYRKDPLWAATVHGKVAIIREKQGDLTLAIKNQNAAHARCKMAHSSIDTMRAASSLGSLHLRRDEVAEASRYFDEALSIAEKSAPVSPDAALCLDRVAHIWELRGDLPTALDCYRRSLSIWQQVDAVSVGPARVLSEMARTHQKQGSPEAAYDSRLMCLEIYRHLTQPIEAYDRIVMARVLVDLSTQELARGSYEQALAHAEESRDVLSTVDSRTSDEWGAVNDNIAQAKAGLNIADNWPKQLE